MLTARLSVRGRPPDCIWPEPPPPANITTPRLSSDGQRLWRRNLAHLTAISRGANTIFDGDCSVFTSDALRVLAFNSTTASGLMYNETRLFNPYEHFGAWAVVPRALHDSSLASARNSRLYYVRDFSKVYIRHGLNEWSGDIVQVKDRLGGDGVGYSRFDPSVPPVFVGQRSFSPAVSHSTLYHHQAFWGLLFPCLADNLRCEILRQLITQRLLRDLDAFSGFYQLHDTTDVKEELHGSPRSNSSFEIGVDVAKLTTFLDAWICKPRVTFFGCLQALAGDLQLNGFLDDVEVSLVRHWLAAIQSLGVAEPSTVSSPWRGGRKITEVTVLLGNVQAFLEYGGPTAKRTLQEGFLDPVRTQCEGNASATFGPVSQWSQPIITDIALIVVFNYNKFFWKNLPYMESIHRPFFKHIVYCTPNLTELMADERSGELGHVTVVEGLSDEWYQMHECLASTARMDLQGVRGYLQIGDDTLLNTWMLFNTSRDTIWLPQGFTTVNLDEPVHKWGWYHWNKPRGRPAILRALSDMERLSGMTSDEILKLEQTKKKFGSPRSKTFSEIFQAANFSRRQLRPQPPGSESWADPSQEEAEGFLSNYIRVNRLLGKIAHRALDLFYIPHVLRDSFVKFSRYFMKRGVIIELAVPALHHGMMRRADVSYIKASSLWYGNRNNTRTFYDRSIFFLHPFKMHGQMGTASGREFFCDVYAQNLFRKLAETTRTGQK
ncbi:hypothetical protein BaRGS_00010100 [Batillaria attramentaria]|uniref:Uncharacterized protein n=1 Tax=Batillaria attramentaria TaxID=370345 RepID=A0ABD0LHZ3_9CAEN